MPAKSENQQQAAGIALSAKRGKTSPKRLFGAAKEMYKSMDEKQLEEFAKTKHKPIKKESSFLAQIRKMASWEYTISNQVGHNFVREEDLIRAIVKGVEKGDLNDPNYRGLVDALNERTAKT